MVDLMRASGLVFLAFLGFPAVADTVLDGNREILKESPMAKVVLTREDNGKTVEMEVGDSLVVQLNESPVTGFTWAVKRCDRRLALQNSDYSPAGAGIMGERSRTRIRGPRKQPAPCSSGIPGVRVGARVAMAGCPMSMC
jgi:hypothetical protein